MDALGTKIELDLKNCRKKLKKFEDAEKRRRDGARALAKRLSKMKQPVGELGATAVLQDILSNKQSLAKAVEEADASAAAAAAPANKGGRRRKTKKRRRKRKTKRKKRKTKKRRRKRKRKTKKRR
jgi:colicin import membrane protein